MSSRQLRKLQQQRELEQARLQAEAEGEAEGEDESEEELVARPQKHKQSLFANLTALGDENEDEGDDNVKEGESEPEPDPDPAPALKAKKPKKKKKKGKNKAADTSAEKSKSDDEIEAALRELNLKQPSSGTNGHDSTPTLDPEYERVCGLLGIQTQHLKVANEMRNLFGKTALESHDDAGGPVGRGARRQRAQPQQVDLETALKGHHPPGKGIPELVLRRNCFIQGRDDWPRGTTGGLTMAVVNGEDLAGTVTFMFVHDQTYQALQQSFYHYVEIGDPQNLIGLLARNPYHISLLTQVSKIAKDQGDHALSSDLLERALFTFGRAATTLFGKKLAEGKARFDFKRPENRELWLAGYQYIKSLVMKGTYRTALEWAKLLLSLDPKEDPYCMRLMIHQLALRAQQFEWLLDICDLKSSANGSSPSIVMSGSNAYRYHIAPSLAFAALQLKDGKRSREILTQSMQQLPWLFARLFQDLNLDAPPSIWGITPRTGAEELFTTLCIKYTKDLWDTPGATALLMEIAHTITKVDAGAIPRIEDAEMTLNVVRFIYLDNTPELMAMVPSALLHRSNNSDSDPLPPEASVISYEAQRIPLQQAPRDALAGFNDPFAALHRLLPRLINLPRMRMRGVGRDIEGVVDIEQAGAEAHGDQSEGLEELLRELDPNNEMPAQTRGWLDMPWLRALAGISVGENENENENADEETETEEEDEDGEMTDDEITDLVE